MRQALAAIEAEVAEPPPDMVAKRSAAQAAGTVTADAESAMQEAARRVAELAAARPRGLRKAYAFLTGGLSRQDAVLAEAHAEAGRTAQHHRTRQVVSDALDRIASTAEASWLAELEDDREGRRAELRERARWLDDAVTVLGASPDLAMADDGALDAAIRAHRTRNVQKDPARDTTPKPRGPG